METVLVGGGGGEGGLLLGLVGGFGGLSTELPRTNLRGK
jgi:hypothetical protein